jgi:hypothetical protein
VQFGQPVSPLEQINSVATNFFGNSNASDPLANAIAQNNVLLNQPSSFNTAQLNVGAPPSASQGQQVDDELAAKLIMAAMNSASHTVPNTTPVAAPAPAPAPVTVPIEESAELSAEATGPIVLAMLSKLIQGKQTDVNTPKLVPSFNQAKWADPEFQANLKRFFDAEFYLEQNPEAANSDLDPWTHYFTIGSQQGHLPLHWDEKGFLDALPQVKTAVEAGEYSSGLEWFVEKISNKKILATITKALEAALGIEKKAKPKTTAIPSVSTSAPDPKPVEKTDDLNEVSLIQQIIELLLNPSQDEGKVSSATDLVIEANDDSTEPESSGTAPEQTATSTDTKQTDRVKDDDRDDNDDDDDDDDDKHDHRTGEKPKNNRDTSSEDRPVLPSPVIPAPNGALPVPPVSTGPHVFVSNRGENNRGGNGNGHAYGHSNNRSNRPEPTQGPKGPQAPQGPKPEPFKLNLPKLTLPKPLPTVSPVPPMPPKPGRPNSLTVRPPVSASKQ